MKRSVVILIALLVGVLGFITWWNLRPAAPLRQAIKPAPQRYVALGDSVAAGFGIRTEVVPPAECFRSNLAYPDLVAQKAGLTVESSACGGATFKEGILGSQQRGGFVLAPQLNKLKQGDRPGLITLTTGANDLKWTETLRSCYTADCAGDAANSGFEASLQAVQADLKRTLQTISAMYENDPPRTIVTGYYQVFGESNAAECLEATGIDPGERDWWSRHEADLNQALQTTAKEFSFVRFASLDFSGHSPCDEEPWVQGLTDSAPFHPTLDGQKAIAEAVVKARDQ
jgi:lysophospholipase L1-like esterase